MPARWYKDRLVDEGGGHSGLAATTRSPDAMHIVLDLTMEAGNCKKDLELQWQLQ